LPFPATKPGHVLVAGFVVVVDIMAEFMRYRERLFAFGQIAVYDDVSGLRIGIEMAADFIRQIGSVLDDKVQILCKVVDGAAGLHF